MFICAVVDNHFIYHIFDQEQAPTPWGLLPRQLGLEIWFSAVRDKSLGVFIAYAYRYLILRSPDLNVCVKVLLILVALVMLASAAALGDSEEAATSLEPGESIAIAIENTDGEDIWIECEVSVLAGPEVCVWFTDEEGYTEFYTPPEDLFTYYPDHSIEDTSYYNESWAWSEQGIFYVIIDNTAEDEMVNVQYTVTWEPYSFSSLFVVAIIAIILVIVIVIVVVLAMVTIKRTEVMAKEAKAEEERRAFEAARPEPPKPYPEWVVSESMRELEDDDATGWDPSGDEPRD